jgi:hypothetical protein
MYEYIYFHMHELIHFHNCWYKLLIVFKIFLQLKIFEMIVDSYAVVRNNAQSSNVSFA